MKWMVRALIAAFIGIVLYLLFWPVPVEPVSWQAPPNPGFTGLYARNSRLSGMDLLDLGGFHGPECAAVDDQGRIYVGVHGGAIVRLDPDGKNPKEWANTGGRPLGMVFDADGNLVVADAYVGLVSVTPQGLVTILAVQADGVVLGYADDVDAAEDGMIYFTDASTKFPARELRNAMETSLLDLLEHGGHGRLLEYDPFTGIARTLVSGLQFANGVAVSHDQKSVLVNETGAYRVVRHWIDGPKKGRTEPVLESLPAFPDNVSRGLDGRYWMALVSPRNALVDKCSDKPLLRKVIQRLPVCLRPEAEPFGHIFAMDDAGRVLLDLQDPEGRQPLNTSVLETKDHLYVGSLVSPALGRLPKDGLGLSGPGASQ